MKKIDILYATKSEFKKAEIHKSLDLIRIGNSPFCKAASEIFNLRFAEVSTKEPLERNLEEMVRQKAISAYEKVLAPCVVEHAGLILPTVHDEHYPGGLTQPMFDALEPSDFVKSLSWSGDKAIARAVVGYCDGFRVLTFVGETSGKLIVEPRGDRSFYWDTIFVPEDGDGMTYAEIAYADLEKKMAISQSRKAFEKCLSYISRNRPELFRN